MDDFLAGFVVAVIVTLFLVPHARVSDTEIIAAQAVCANNGGIEFVRGSGVRSTKIWCNNGAVFTPTVEDNRQVEE